MPTQSSSMSPPQDGGSRIYAIDLVPLCLLKDKKQVLQVAFRWRQAYTAAFAWVSTCIELDRRGIVRKITDQEFEEHCMKPLRLLALQRSKLLEYTGYDFTVVDLRYDMQPLSYCHKAKHFKTHRESEPDDGWTCLIARRRDQTILSTEERDNPKKVKRLREEHAHAVSRWTDLSRSVFKGPYKPWPLAPVQSIPKQAEPKPVASRPQPLATVLQPFEAPRRSSHAPRVLVRSGTGSPDSVGFVAAVEALRTALRHLKGEAGTVRPVGQEISNQLSSYAEFIHSDIIKAFISFSAVNGADKRPQRPVYMLNASQEARAEVKVKILDWAQTQDFCCHTEFETRNNRKVALELKLIEAQNLHQAMLGQDRVVLNKSANIVKHCTQQLERNEKAMSRLTEGYGALQQLLADLQPDQKQW